MGWGLKLLALTAALLWGGLAALAASTLVLLGVVGWGLATLPADWDWLTTGPQAVSLAAGGLAFVACAVACWRLVRERWLLGHGRGQWAALGLVVSGGAVVIGGWWLMGAVGLI